MRTHTHARHSSQYLTTGNRSSTFSTRGKTSRLLSFSGDVGERAAAGGREHADALHDLLLRSGLLEQLMEKTAQAEVPLPRRPDIPEEIQRRARGRHPVVGPVQQ